MMKISTTLILQLKRYVLPPRHLQYFAPYSNDSSNEINILLCSEIHCHVYSPTTWCHPHSVSVVICIH